jgi:hypothetical protein
MLLNPASLSVKSELDLETAQKVAEKSPLEDAKVVSKLVSTLAAYKSTDSQKARLTQSLALKILVNQIEVRGKPYIEFLEGIDSGKVMAVLMGYLQAEKEKTNTSSVLPQKWIESKIARIRKLAIETAQSLAIQESEVQVTTMLSADGE